MNIKVKHPDDNWILGNWGREIQKRMPQADGRLIRFYVQYNMFTKRENPEDINVVYFTHDNKDGIFERTALQADFCICQAPQYERFLRSKGIKNVCTIPCPPPEIDMFKPKLMLAWIGHFFSPFRKGQKGSITWN